MTSMMLGGIRMPSVPAAPIVPVAKGGRIPPAQHHGQRHQRHHHDRGADDSGRGGHDRAHDGDRQGQPAGYAPQKNLETVQQIPRDIAAFQHDSHQNEHRNRRQNEIFSDAAIQPDEDVEELPGRERPQQIADAGEEQPYAAENETHRKAAEQQDGQGHEHEDGQQIDEGHGLVRISGCCVTYAG